MSDFTLRHHNNNHRRNRTKTDKPTFEFFSKPSTLEALSLTTTNPSFNHNVTWFCSDYAELESYKIDGFRIWLCLLVNRRNGVVFPLYLVEELARPDPDGYFCFHCISAGWGNHFVSKRRYHMIVPEEGRWGKCLSDDALNEGRHLLHGMIHCNGFGHLLAMNGTDTSTASLSRVEVMELFDLMCQLLKTRKVTVRDALRKGPMELRLLHTIMYGKSWYGEWGYKFCKGSFGVTEQMYNRSVELLTSLSISKVLSDFSGDEVLSKIINNYKDACETQLTTIGELLDFMLGFKSIRGAHAHTVPMSESLTCTSPQVKMKNELKRNRAIVSSPNKSGISKYSKLASWAERLDCRYPKRRLESSAQTVVSILQSGLTKDNRCAQMGRHELREIMRQHIGDTGLIDFVLKSMNNVHVGDFVVRRIYNSGIRKLEFSIEPFKGPRTPAFVSDNKNKTALPPPLEPPHFSVVVPLSEPELPNSVIMPRTDVLDDIFYIYRCILKGYKNSDSVVLASNAIIDCQLFVKEWKLEEVKNNMSTWVVFRVLPKHDELKRFFTRPLPPGEIIEVSTGIEMEHLKMRLQCVLRDTYCIMDEFVVEEVLNHGTENGEELCMQVWVKGSGLDVENLLRYEAGPCNWKVNCHKCGTTDDDGEDMVYCIGCKVLMHFRCNSDIISDKNVDFKCSLCRT